MTHAKKPGDRQTQLCERTRSRSIITGTWIAVTVSVDKEPPMPVPAVNRDELHLLRPVVREHRVVFHVSPAVEFVAGERMNVGFDVELLGAHPPGARGVLPGCEHCRGVWNDLRRVADAVRPEADERLSYTAIPDFDRAIHTTPTREPVVRDDVRLTISIRHKNDYSTPIDQCEEGCLRDVVGALRELGAQENRWRPPTS